MSQVQKHRRADKKLVAMLEVGSYTLKNWFNPSKYKVQKPKLEVQGHNLN